MTKSGRNRVNSKVDRKISPEEIPGLDASKLLQNRFEIAFNSLLLFLQFQKIEKVWGNVHVITQGWQKQGPFRF